jgi:putative hemolysin
MTEPWNDIHLTFGWSAAVLCFMLQMGLSVALEAVATLSRAALYRLSTSSNGQTEFLNEMQEPNSSYRLASQLLHQLCLLGGVYLVVITAAGSGWQKPQIIGFGLGALFGVLLVDMVVARSLALWNARIALKRTALLIRLARSLLFPIVIPLRALHAKFDQSQTLTEEQLEEEQEEEVEALIEVGEREGLLEAEEGAMMRGIVDLDDTRVREIMTPRTEIISLPVNTTIGVARKAFMDAKHSRLPVYRGSIDNVVGILHVRDLVLAWEDRDDKRSISQYMRSVTYVPEPLTAAELLGMMRLKTRMAIVVDEYGGVAGLVTLEDILEEIVGEIRDEHDQGDEESIREESDGVFIIAAVTHVKELEALFDIEFTDRDYDTVSGLVVSVRGRVPAEKEILRTHGLSIEVIKADPRRVVSVRVSKQSYSDPEAVDDGR